MLLNLLKDIFTDDLSSFLSPDFFNKSHSKLLI